MMTPTPFERLASFDRLVHEPARLAILTALSACEKADFVFLRSLTRLTKGNLSSHLSKLEHAGLVSLEKMFEVFKTVEWGNRVTEGLLCGACLALSNRAIFVLPVSVPPVPPASPFLKNTHSSGKSE
jgi:DNA-binding transcriptional ArsR family regulator